MYIKQKKLLKRWKYLGCKGMLYLLKLRCTLTELYCTLLSNSKLNPIELCCTLTELQSTLTDLWCTLLSYAAPRRATLHPNELKYVGLVLLGNNSFIASIWKVLQRQNCFKIMSFKVTQSLHRFKIKGLKWQNRFIASQLWF
jgi:hypothetical protein